MNTCWLELWSLSNHSFNQSEQRQDVLLLHTCQCCHIISCTTSGSRANAFSWVCKHTNLMRIKQLCKVNRMHQVRNTQVHVPHRAVLLAGVRLADQFRNSSNCTKVHCSQNMLMPMEFMYEVWQSSWSQRLLPTCTRPPPQPPSVVSLQGSCIYLYLLQVFGSRTKLFHQNIIPWHQHSCFQVWVKNKQCTQAESLSPTHSPTLFFCFVGKYRWECLMWNHALYFIVLSVNTINTIKYLEMVSLTPPFLCSLISSDKFSLIFNAHLRADSR